MLPTSDKQTRYPGWIAAARREGVIYMACERAFWLLSFVSPASWRFRIARRAHARAVPKLDPVVKDIWKLVFFIIAGVALPLYLNTKAKPEHPLSLCIFATWMVVLVMQHHINTAVFDPFRGNRLPIPQKTWAWCRILDCSIGRLLPLDDRKSILDKQLGEMQGYALTSMPRRLILAVMDFWLLLVGFAMLHWSVPNENSYVFNSAVQVSISFDTALYFSIVTGTTLGYGDIFPYTPIARLIVIIEVLSSFFFAGTLLSYAAGLLPKSDEIPVGNDETPKEPAVSKEPSKDGPSNNSN